MRVSLIAATLVAVTAPPKLAAAIPQYNVALIPALSFATERPRVAFDAALHADVLFGRDYSADIGVGPSLELGTRAFDNLRVAPGLSVQIPVLPIDFVLTGSPIFRFAEHADFGAGARVFVGSRAVNHYSQYALAVGAVLAGDVLFADAPEASVRLGLHVDAEWVAIPWLVLVSWFR